MRNAYIEALYELTQENRNIYSFVADNGAIVFDKYREKFPENFINFGLAECTMVSVAAGMASCGHIPFIYTIIPFLVMRAYEQIRNDICMQEMNVKIVGIGAGVRYSTLGPTHHAIEDIALMRVLPNMTIISPADSLETKKATKEASKIKGPVYIRLGTSKEPVVYKDDYRFEAGKGVLIRPGEDVTLVATGNSVYDAQIACEELERKGKSVRLINIHTIKPIDEDIIIKAAEETRAIITIENHSIIGGLGSAVAEILVKKYEGKIKLKHMGFNDNYCFDYGTHAELKNIYGLAPKQIISLAEEIIKK